MTRAGAGHGAGRRVVAARAAALTWLLSVFATPAPARPPNVYRALTLFRAKRYEKLLKLLEGVTEGPPRLFTYRAESLAALDRRPEAVAAFQELIEKHPDHPDAFDARRKVMLLLEQDKNYPALIEAIRGFRDDDAAGRLPYDRLEADAQFKAGHIDEAIALLEDEEDPADLRTLAEILTELDRVESYLKDHPVAETDLPALRRRGLLLEQLRRPQQAVGYFRRVLAAAPRDRVALEHLAAAASAGEDLPLAIDCYRKLVDLDPGELKFAAQLGKLLWQAGKPAQAREAWERIVAVEAPDSQRFRLLIRLYLDHEDAPHALKQVAAGRKALGSSRLFREEEESAHRLNRDLRAAVRVWIPLLVQPLETGTGAIDPRDRIREIAAAGGKSGEAARAEVMAAVRRYPDMVEYTLLAAELLKLDGRDAEISGLIDSLIRGVGDRPAALHGFALRFRDEGYPREAAALFIAAKRRADPDQRWALSLEAATSLREVGEAKRARRQLAAFWPEAAEPPPQFLLRAVDLEGRLLLEDLHENAAARAHYTRWIPELDPDSPFVVPWVVLAARGAAAAGDFAAAETAYKALLERGGNKRHTAEVYFRLGRLHLFAGDLEQARQILRKVGEDYPDADVANDAVSDVAFLLGHKDVGEPELKRFLALRHLVDAGRPADFRAAIQKDGPAELGDAPGDLRDDYALLFARAAEALGETGAVRALLKKGAEADPEGPLLPEFLSRLARAEEARGATDAAIAAWKDYLLRHPDSLELDEVRGRIKRLEAKRKAAAPGG